MVSALVLIGVFAITFVGNPFGPSLHLRARFLEVSGLREGAEVRVAGVPLGKVTKIDLLPPSPVPGAPRVEVFLSLPDKIGDLPATERIRTDSVASIQIFACNTHETVIDIQPGTIVGQPVHDGAILPTSSSNTVNDFPNSGSDRAEFFKQLEETRKRLDEMRAELEKNRTAKKGAGDSSPAPPVAGATPDYNKILERLNPGIILFDPPSKMTVGTREQVRVRLAKSVTPELSQGVTDYDRTIVDTVAKIGSTMRVQLKGEAADFEIYPISHEEQVVSDTDVTEWTWNVTPTTAGPHKLSILVTIVLGDKQKDYPAYQKEILVSVNPLYSATRFVRINWQPLASIIIGSGVIGTIVAWRKRRKQNKRPPPWQAA